MIEPVYGMARPADDDRPRARSNRAAYELHDRAGERTSVVFAQQRFATASDLLLGGSTFPAMQNFLLAARAQGLGGVPDQQGVVRRGAAAARAVGVPDDRMLAGHVVVGRPRGRHGPLRRRPLCRVVALDRRDGPADALVGDPPPRPPG